MKHIEYSELESFLAQEINKAISNIQNDVAEDKLKQETIIRLATEINVLNKIKAKFKREG